MEIFLITFKTSTNLSPSEILALKNSILLTVINLIKGYQTLKKKVDMIKSNIKNGL